MLFIKNNLHVLIIIYLLYILFYYFKELLIDNYLIIYK